MQRTPFQFRPMGELVEPDAVVEMALYGTGEVVDGWLSTGVRAFWTRDVAGKLAQIDPIGWRHPPAPEAIAAWKAQQAAA